MRKKFGFLLALLLFAIPGLAQERGKVQATVNGKAVKIDYGRPSLRGRDMLAMAQTGTVWRLGMNEATEIDSSGAIMVEGKELKAGKYSLWAKKVGPDKWVLAFHPKTGVWGAPELTTGYVAELPLKVEKAPKPSEELTINLQNQSGAAGIIIHWGSTQLIGSFGVK